MNLFDRVLCISLESSVERRKHIDAEFKSVGIENHQFIKAFEADSQEVLDLLDSDFVHKYPPCFRCGHDQCNCENKALFAPQIGNWLSHMAAWKKVCSTSGELYLVCEDDLKFTSRFQATLNFIEESEEIRNQLASGLPVLIRLGWALSNDHDSDIEPCFTNEIKMSNPCYALNAAMADLTLNSLTGIKTTSDIYLHRDIAPLANHYTAFPPIAYELSWSTGEIRSEIRPKQKHIEYLRKQLSMYSQDADQCKIIRLQIQNEQQRLREFESDYTNAE